MTPSDVASLGQSVSSAGCGLSGAVGHVPSEESGDASLDGSLEAFTKQLKSSLEATASAVSGLGSALSKAAAAYTATDRGGS